MERGKGESVNTEYGEIKNKGDGDGGRERRVVGKENERKGKGAK